MMEYMKLFSLIATAVCIVMVILNSHNLDAKFHEWRIKRKNRRAGWDIYAIVENARRRRR